MTSSDITVDQNEPSYSLLEDLWATTSNCWQLWSDLWDDMLSPLQEQESLLQGLSIFILCLHHVLEQCDYLWWLTQIEHFGLLAPSSLQQLVIHQRSTVDIYKENLPLDNGGRSEDVTIPQLPSVMLTTVLIIPGVTMMMGALIGLLLMRSANNRSTVAVVGIATLLFLECLVPLVTVLLFGSYVFASLPILAGLNVMIVMWLGGTIGVHCVRCLVYQQISNGADRYAHNYIYGPIEG